MNYRAIILALALAPAAASAEEPIDWDASLAANHIVYAPVQPGPNIQVQQKQIQKLDDQSFDHAVQQIDARVRKQQCSYGYWDQCKGD